MKLIIDYKLDNWNDTINKSRTNYAYANDIKQKEMKIIEFFIKEQNLKPIEKYPIKLNCVWHVKYFKGDLDNKSLKSVLDQLQKSNILKNDNLKHINEINHKVMKDTHDYLELEMIESE